MEIPDGIYCVISPTTAQCVAKIVVRPAGLEILSGPHFTERMPTEELLGHQDILDFNRATDILRRGRLKAPPDFMAGQGSILFQYETASNIAGDLILQAQRREVLPPTFADTLITHAVAIVVFQGSNPIGQLSITGILPLDGSPVKSQLVVSSEVEGLFVKES